MSIHSYLKKIRTLFDVDHSIPWKMFKDSVYSRILLFWNSNPKCRRINVQQHIYDRLKKEYKYILNDRIACISEKPENYQPTIWISWLQGYDKAPQLVKRCVDSIYRNMAGKFNIVFITEDNFSEYVDMPDYILQKWRKGIISHAHFSDLLRLQLLINRGGVDRFNSIVYEC